jgi:hypothetical protein
VLSILSPEWEDKPSRETKVLYWNAVATLFRPLAEACKDSSDDEDDGSGLEDSSCDILTVSVLQGSQVAPGLSMSLRIRPRFKRLHTYIHATHVGVVHEPFKACRYLPDASFSLHTYLHVDIGPENHRQWPITMLIRTNSMLPETSMGITEGHVDGSTELRVDRVHADVGSPRFDKDA